MKDLSLGLIATLGLSVACSNGVNTGGGTTTSSTSAATSTDTQKSSGTSSPETNPPKVESDSGSPGKDRDGGPASAPADGGGSVPGVADASLPEVSPGDGGEGENTSPGLPPLPPPCGGLCDDGEKCNVATDKCVECLVDLDCSEGNECRDNACEAIVPCTSSDTCPEGLLVCHSQLDRCVECEIDLDCPEAHRCEARACVAEPQTSQCAMGEDPCKAGAIARMTEAQSLDGYGDEFCGIPGFELNFRNAARGNSDLPQSMVMRVAWSAEALHLYAEVEDSEVVTNDQIEYLWSGDVVELYLAPRPLDQLEGFFSGRVDGVQLLIAPPTASNPARAARLFWLPNEQNPDSYVQVREELTSGFAARATRAGYTVEARLPWSMFGPRTPEIEKGLRIAFDVGLSTANAGSIGNANDGRQGAAVLYAGPAAAGLNTCSGDQMPWCNSTTWCSTTLEQRLPEVEVPQDAGVR